VFGWLGLLVACFSKSPFSDGPVLFFATADLGGAEKIHTDIVSAISEQKPTVVLTEIGRTNELLPRLSEYAAVIRLGAKLKRRALAYYHAGKLAGWLNSSEPSVVFGSFSHLFYDVLPMLKKGTHSVDLLHNFGANFENYSLRHIGRIQQRVVISETLKGDLLAQYEAFGTGHSNRIAVIRNATDVPEECPNKKGSGPLKILYVGRGSAEKRVHLVGKIASALDPSIAQVTLVGDVERSIKAADRESCQLVGVVTEPPALTQLFAESHILLLTSEREGLPVALLEAMAHGVVPITTSVGAIPEVVSDGINGRLLDSRAEPEIVQKAVECVNKLADHRGALQAMSSAAYNTARSDFGREAFNEAWRQVFGVQHG
jgi:glycosyltransferase involved in cell wall biosynthesis